MQSLCSGLSNPTKTKRPALGRAFAITAEGLTTGWQALPVLQVQALRPEQVQRSEPEPEQQVWRRP